MSRSKGGRYVGENGYVRVLAPWHPAGDERGYVYEHRLVAEWKLKRRLRRGELVHHRDHDKTNNTPSNLEVLSSAEHHAAHRVMSRGLRDPGERNPLVACGCRCGKRLRRFDGEGRRRLFIQGHNRRRT